MRFLNYCFRYSLGTSSVWQHTRLLRYLHSPVNKIVLKSSTRYMASFPVDSKSGIPSRSVSSSGYMFHGQELKVNVEDVSFKSMLDHVVIRSLDGNEMKASGRWLRDHCKCNECFNESSYQNLYDINICSKPLIAKMVQNENEICIEWSDGHVSVYVIDWLLDKIANKPNRYQNRQLWNVDKFTSANVSDVSFKDYMNDPGALAECLRNIYTYGIAFINDVPTTKEDLVTLAERICFMRECEHGKDDIVVSSEEKKFEDIAYTNLALGFHTDSAYSVEPFGYMVFHIMEHTGDGGLGHYVDGFHVAELIRKDNPDAYRILSEVMVTQEFIDTDVHYKGSHPIVTIRDNEVHMIRYQINGQVLVEHRSLEDTELFYDALNLFHKLLYSPQNAYWMKYTPGRVVLFDNFRLLHGRSVFTGKRVLRNLILPRDEVDSRIRTLTGLGKKD